MKHEISLTASYSKLLHRSAPKTPRWRFMRYYIDLMNLYGKKLDEKVFNEGSQYSYSELGEAVLDKCHAEGALKDLDLMVVSYWSNEFDPDHATCGAYFSEKYQLNCKIFDVCEQGTVAPFTAIRIIHSFLQNTHCKKGLLLILEQTTIPRVKEDYDVIPSQSGVVAVFFEKKSFDVTCTIASSSSDSIYNLYEADVINENIIANKNFNIFNYIQREYLHSTDHNDVLYLIKKNHVHWKEYQYLSNQSKNKIKAQLFSSEPGCLQPFFGLQNTMKTSTEPFVVLLDEDVESFNTGILILKNPAYVV